MNWTFRHLYTPRIVTRQISSIVISLIQGNLTPCAYTSVTIVTSHIESNVHSGHVWGGGGPEYGSEMIRKLVRKFCRLWRAEHHKCTCYGIQGDVNGTTWRIDGADNRSPSIGNKTYQRISLPSQNGHHY